jgi:hypothetical protein
MRPDLGLAARGAQLGFQVGELQALHLQRADLQLPLGIQALQAREIDGCIGLLGRLRGRLTTFGGRLLLLGGREVAIEIELIDVEIESIGHLRGARYVDPAFHRRVVQPGVEIDADRLRLERIGAVQRELGVQGRRVSLQRRGEIDLALRVLGDAPGLEIEVGQGNLLPRAQVAVGDR